MMLLPEIFMAVKELLFLVNFFDSVLLRGIQHLFNLKGVNAHIQQQFGSIIVVIPL
jgi:hypothetical protein